MKTLTTFLVVVYALLNAALAQQSTRFTQYAFNPMLVNPATIGQSKSINLSTGFKSMWGGIPGAPNTQFLSAEGSMMNRKFGWGTSIMNDEAGLLQQRSVLMNFSYRKRLSDKTSLTFGIGAGPKQYVYNGQNAKYENPDDIAIPNSTVSIIKPNFNAGVYLRTQKMMIGVSVDNLIDQSIDFTSVNRPETGTTVERMNILAGREFELTPTISFNQMFLVKLEKNNPVQIDITPSFTFNKRFTIGAGYRHMESASLMIQNNITDYLKVGYSYDYQLNGLNTVSNGSHELMLMYQIKRFGSSFEHPRYFY